MHKLNDQPDFVNEEGVKWWKDEDLTDYARRKDVHGTRLEHIVVWQVEFPDGVKTRLLVDNDKGEPLYENQGLEAMAVRIDVMKMLKRNRVNARKD